MQSRRNEGQASGSGWAFRCPSDQIVRVSSSQATAKSIVMDKKLVSSSRLTCVSVAPRASAQRSAKSQIAPDTSFSLPLSLSQQTAVIPQAPANGRLLIHQPRCAFAYTCQVCSELCLADVVSSDWARCGGTPRKPFTSTGSTASHVPTLSWKPHCGRNRYHVFSEAIVTLPL